MSKSNSACDKRAIPQFLAPTLISRWVIGGSVTKKRDTCHVHVTLLSRWASQAVTLARHTPLPEDPKISKKSKFSNWSQNVGNVTNRCKMYLNGGFSAFAASNRSCWQLLGAATGCREGLAHPPAGSAGQVPGDRKISKNQNFQMGPKTLETLPIDVKCI